MAYDAYLGGIDVIKDDELLVADPAWCPIEKRVKAITEAGLRAYEPVSYTHLPGQIQLKGEKLPDLTVGDYIKIQFLGEIGRASCRERV